MEHINGDGYEIKEKTFQRNGTYIAYPTIVSEANSERANVWNNIIWQDIADILEIYSDYTLIPTPEGENLYLPDILRITYEIKCNDSRYLSIFYTANFYSPYAAHPTQMIYTTNIEKMNNRRVKLSDFITNVGYLTYDINSWEIVTKNDGIKEYSQAIRDYINGLGKEILRMGFESADIIGPDNYLGIFSYLTPDKLGVSISVPNYLGDHVEFERNLTVPGTD